MLQAGGVAGAGGASAPGAAAAPTVVSLRSPEAGVRAPLQPWTLGNIAGGDGAKKGMAVGRRGNAGHKVWNV